MQASCHKIQSSFIRARSAFRDATYPVWKHALVNRASEFDVRSNVIQALRHLPDQEYISADDAMRALDNIENIVQPFICLEYPVTKGQLIEAARF
jgi:hypothetical protein